MTGWLFIIGAALIAGGLLFRWTRLPRGGQYLMAAFLMLGLAGYAWQGHPSTPGAPVSRINAEPKTDGSVRRFASARFGPVGETLGYTEAWLKAGRPDLALRVIKQGLKANPNSPDLWLAMGGALSAAGDGVIVPAADYAFDRARALSPDHPGVLFFDGLAAAQGDDVENAARIWLKLYETSPPDAPWRLDVEMRLSAIAQMVRTVPNSNTSGPAR